MLVRPGSARPIDSKVLRPIMMGWPIVSFLNRGKSPSIFQIKPPARPIARVLAPIAATMLIFPFVIKCIILYTPSDKPRDVYLKPKPHEPELVDEYGCSLEGPCGECNGWHGVSPPSEG